MQVLSSSVLLSLLLYAFLPTAAGASLEDLEGLITLQHNFPNTMRENMHQVEKITRQRTALQVQKALVDADAVPLKHGHYLAPDFNYALGGLQPYWQFFSMPQAISFTGIAATIASIPVAVFTFILKRKYHYPRPYVINNQLALVHGKKYNKHAANAYFSFPSGHTAIGYTNALFIAQIIPERYSELMTAAADFGRSRVELGVHYPLDIIGSRIMVSSIMADILSHPAYRFLIHLARLEARASMQLRCHGTISDCVIRQVGQNVPSYYRSYEDKAANHRRFNHDLNYALTPIMSKNFPMIVPKNAQWLIFTRFPYLSSIMRRQILESTALPSGDPLDRQDSFGSWQRINLYEAVDGPKQLTEDWLVDMNGDWREKLFSGWTNPYYQQDSWRNNIRGTGRLLKAGKGRLNLMGQNTFSGVTVLSGQLSLIGENHFSASSEVKGGTLVIDGSLYSKEQLIIGEKGVLRGAGLISAPLAVYGRLIIDGALPLSLHNKTYFFPTAIIVARNLGVLGALQLQGKTTHLQLGGTLDARNSFPGSLVDIYSGASISGNFVRIMQPVYLRFSPFFYDVLLHKHGVNLFINSPWYPPISSFHGNEREGAALLIRLQGSKKTRSDHRFVSWLTQALNTGEMAGAPHLLHGQIYADIADVLLNEVLSTPVLFTRINGKKTGQAIAINYAFNKYSSRQQSGFLRTNEYHRRLLVYRYWQIHDPVWQILEGMQYSRHDLSQTVALAQAESYLFTLGISHYGWRSYFEIPRLRMDIGLNIGAYRSKVRRYLAYFGNSHIQQSGKLLGGYARLGYEFLHHNWQITPNLSYGYALLTSKASQETGSALFLSQLPAQHQNISRLKLGFDVKKPINMKYGPLLMYFSIYDDMRLSREGTKTVGKLCGLIYENLSQQQVKHRLVTQIGWEYKTAHASLSFNADYKKAGPVHGVGAQFIIKYSF